MNKQAGNSEATWQSCSLGKCYRIVSDLSCHPVDRQPPTPKRALGQPCLRGTLAAYWSAASRHPSEMLPQCLPNLLHHVQKPLCTISTTHTPLIRSITQTKKILERSQPNLQDLCKTSCGHGWFPAAAAFPLPSFQPLNSTCKQESEDVYYSWQS